MKKLVTFLLILFIFIATPICAYDIGVHEEINQAATKTSQLNSFLKNQLGYTQGIDTILNGYDPGQVTV